MRLIDIDDDRNIFCGINGDYEKWNIDPDVLKEAQPERKKGEWIPYSNYNNSRFLLTNSLVNPSGVRCSECGFETHNKLHATLLCPYRFCPNCGADMRGKQDG